MSTLEEIQAAADALSPAQKQELLVYLAARLRTHGAAAPEPRRFTPAQTKAWLVEDQADMKRFREGK